MHLCPLLIVTVALCGSACQNAAGPDAGGTARDGSPVQTDSSVYQLRRTTNAYEATARATYVNRTGSSVFFARCGVGSYTGPLFSIRRTGADSMRPLWTEISWGCVGSVPTGEVRAGDSLTVEVPLGGHDQPAASPPLQIADLIGLMRVAVELCAEYHADSDDCSLSPLPQALRQSNVFDVRY
jgi:hypothetical protein